MTVPCNGCTRCCRNDIVRLLPEDDASQYETMPHPFKPGELALKHGASGNCVYLADSGCSIHDRSPQMCREMDCRNIARGMTFTQARRLEKAGMIRMAVYQKGKDLIRMVEGK